MAKAKIADDTRTQQQKFVDAARDPETSENEDAFAWALQRVATAPAHKPNKRAAKRK